MFIIHAVLFTPYALFIGEFLCKASQFNTKKHILAYLTKHIQFNIFHLWWKRLKHTSVIPSICSSDVFNGQPIVASRVVW